MLVGQLVCPFSHLAKSAFADFFFNVVVTNDPFPFRLSIDLLSIFLQFHDI